MLSSWLLIANLKFVVCAERREYNKLLIDNKTCRQKEGGVSPISYELATDWVNLRVDSLLRGLLSLHLPTI